MELEFINRIQQAGDAVSFIFRPSEPMAWKAGQYMDFEIPHASADERGTHRWFTISSAPSEKNIMITTRLFTKPSSFKRSLDDLNSGQIILSGLPRGDFTISETNLRHVFIAGGIGITPFRSILTQAAHDNLQLSVDLFYLNKDTNYVFSSELVELQNKNSNLKIHKLTGQPLLKENLSTLSKNGDSIFYISGPRPMVESYEQTLKEIVSPERIKTDYFPGY